MRNVWFRIQGTAKDGPHDWVSTYDEVQGHSDTREERRINGWLASQPIGTVAELGDGWTMTRIHPPARANDSKSARVLARSRWGQRYQQATLTKAGRKLARWRWQSAGPAAAARVKLEAKRDTLRSDLSDLNAYRRVLRAGGRDNQIERQLEQVQQDRIDLHDAIQKVDDQIERAKVRGKQQGSQLGLALGNPPQIARARRNPGSTLARAARRRGSK